MDFFEKLEDNPYKDLAWNIPEKKQGSVNVIGGNSQHFRTEVKIAEYLNNNYPLESIGLILPDSLKNQLPPLPNFCFLESTDSGSFAENQKLLTTFNQADINLLIGDLSKNSITGKAIASAVKSSEKTTIITRDSVDLLTENNPDRWLMNDNVIIMASMAQLQKVLKAVYYPKILLLSQSLIQVVETLHKFTLSYPIAIITLHNDQLLIAKNGFIKALPLSKTNYSPMGIWSGEAASKIAAMNLYNPNNIVKATACALFKN